jgi:hypothetical protein
MYKFRDLVYKKYLQENRFLYHITPTINIPEILKNGLKIFNGVGICNVIVNDEIINQYIVDSQLSNTGETHFTLIRISPEKYGLTISDLCKDGTIEVTNPLHLYILRDTLLIEESDLIGVIHFDPAQKNNKEEVEKRVKELIFEINVSMLDQ